MEYVGLLVQFGMLDEELKPYVVPAKITRSGFDFSLGEKVEAFASNAGFSVDRVKDAVRQLLARNPAQLPVPLTVHAVLQIECRYGVFYRAMAVKAFQERVGVFIKTKQTFIITDVFRD